MSVLPAGARAHLENAPSVIETHALAPATRPGHALATPLTSDFTATQAEAAAAPDRLARAAAYGLFDTQSYLPGARVTVKTRLLRRAGDDGAFTRKITVQEPEHQGVLAGHDPFGRAVVHLDDGVSQARVKFAYVSPDLDAGVSPATLRARAKAPDFMLDGISPSQIHTAPERLRAAVDRCLDRPAVGTHSAREFVSALQAKGEHVSLVGGAIRDAMFELEANPHITDAELDELCSDVDLVTSATPEKVREMAAQVAADVPEGQRVWTPLSINRFGMVGLGERKNGVDIASLRTGLGDKTGVTLGRRLVDDVGCRDFSVNQLYLDLESGRIIDPTGSGLTDARARMLRPNLEDAEKNKMLALRWIKFRSRGFTAAPGGATAMSAHARKSWAEMAAFGSSRVANDVLRIAPGSAHDDAAMGAFLDKLRAVAGEDGMTEAFDAHIAPHRQAIIDTARQRHEAAP